MDKKVSIISFATLLAVLVLAGWSCGQGYGVSNYNEDTTNSDATADWQTYRNDTYGVEFKYPQGWVFWENQEGSDALISISFDVESADLTSSIDFSISSHTSTFEEDLADFAVDSDVLEQGTMSIGDIEWRRFVIKQRETPLQFVFYSTEHDGRSYGFSSDYAGGGTGGGVNQRNVDILLDMLGSFRFVE